MSIKKYYYHYSSNEIKEIENRKYTQLTSWKPYGFWLSQEDEWLKWCENNNFFTFDPINYYKHYIDISSCNLYIIDSLKSLKKCINKYNNKWDKMKEEGYDGVLFTNYHETKQELLNSKYFINPKYIWFSGVDINSICVWNTDKLKISGTQRNWI